MSEETRYGKFPFGASRWNSTVVASTFLTPAGVSTPANVDSALDAFLGSASCWNVYTTSSAVIGEPLWNVTFGRSLNVHTVPSLFGVQLSASIGWSASFRLESKIRNSPVWLSIVRPPASAIVSGLTAAAGVTDATRSVPPLVGAAALVLEEPPDVDAELDEPPPQAARIAPRSGIDMPIVLPRRKKSRRLRFPDTSSSM